MSPDRVCSRCGRLVPRGPGPSNGSLCAECRTLTGPPPSASPLTAGDFLIGLIFPGFKAQDLSRGSVIAIGIVTTLCTIGFGALGGYALFTPDTALPPQFGYGMLGLGGLCLLGGLACFVPRSRWWVLPLLAGLIGAIVILLRLSKRWRP